MRAVILPGAAEGSVLPPASKSLAHRALIAAALAAGETTLEGLFPPGGLPLSEDLQATLAAVQALGAAVQPLPGGRLRLRGAGFPAAPAGPVDCGASGSTMRFLIPLFALTGRPVQLTGRPGLLRRPLQPYARLFAGRGLPFSAGPGGVRLCGPLPAGEYRISGALSSQFITGLLLALPLLAGDSLVRVLPPFVSRPYVQMTLGLLAAFGVQAHWQDPLTLLIPGGQQYRPQPRFLLEADYSQAAFFAALGALSGRVEVLGLQPDSLQGDRVLLDCLARMGAPAQPTPGGGLCWARAPLRGGRFDLADCPDLGPPLAVLCCLARGPSVLCHAGRLRLKESDRPAALIAELKKLGLTLSAGGPDGDSLTTPGWQGGPLPAPTGPLDSWQDHRVAMALAVAATRAGGPVVLRGAQAVGKSYPQFFDRLQALGVRLQLEP